MLKKFIQIKKGIKSKIRPNMEFLSIQTTSVTPQQTLETSVSSYQNVDVLDTRINLEKVPISALRHRSLNLLSIYLDPLKILPSPDGLSRDWRGIFYLTGLPNEYLQYLSQQSQATMQLLDIWQKESNSDKTEYIANISQLQRFLETIDRLDCLDDTNEMFGKFIIIP